MKNEPMNDHPAKSDIVIAVYNHYQALALNEHSLINQRIMHFFLGNTFLFSGYIACFNVSRDHLLLSVIMRIRFWLPIISVLLSIVYAVLFIIPTIKALRVWSSHLEQIEKNYLGQFLSEVCLPFEARKKFSSYSKWPLYWGFPLQLVFFIVLWGLSISW